ncbi:MAG: dienelactone hydrolase family protein [Tepidisphaeraceae bacterium]
MQRYWILFFSICAIPYWSYADVVITPVDYSQGGEQLQGWLAYDNTTQNVRPGVVIFPEWWGLTDYPKHRAEELAKLGYVAFAADMYGKGVTTDDAGQATSLSGRFYNDPDLMRARAQAGLDQLKNDPRVDARRMAAIGYCFGGTCALELARSGADLAGTISFHGGLKTTRPDDAKNIKGKILVITGGDDAFISPAQVNAFEDEMRTAGVDWQVVVYGGAHHAFTNPDADRHGIPNIKYDPEADHRSWAEMQAFFAEIFGQ